MFIHFLHDQLISLYALDRRVSRRVLVEAMRRALLSCAYLADGPLIVPTTDLVQSPVIGELMAELRQLADKDALYFVGSTVNIDELKNLKVAHFGGTGFHRQWTTASAVSQLRPFEASMRSRALSTTAEVRDRWVDDVARLAGENGPALTPTVRQLRAVRELLPSQPSPARFEEALICVPQRLERHAFLWHVVEELKIFPYTVPPPARGYLERVLAWNWARSYLDEYRTSLVSCMPGVGYVDCGITSTHPEAAVDLVAFEAAMGCLGLRHAFQELPLAEILKLRHNPHAIVLRDTVVFPLTRYFMPGPQRRHARRSLMLTAAAIAHAVRGAINPADAMERAAWHAAGDRDRTRSFARSVPLSRSAPEAIPAAGPVVRIIVVIALTEEFSVIKNVVERVAGPLTVAEDAKTGRLSYILPWQTASGTWLEFVFSLVGRGTERAATATAILVSAFDPDVIVNVGIAGTMSSDDVRLGDVVAGDQVVNYLANSKAKGDGASGYTFALSGDVLRSDELLIDRFRQLPLMTAERVEQWANRQRARLETVLPEPDDRIWLPRLVVGPIASGPIVGASDAFKESLLGTKRDYAAIEMETAGVAMAAELGGMVRRIRFLALRGISDAADGNKNHLERQTKGAVRTLALEGAIEAMLLLFETLSPQILSRNSQP